MLTTKELSKFAVPESAHQWFLGGRSRKILKEFMNPFYKKTVLVEGPNETSYLFPIEFIREQ